MVILEMVDPTSNPHTRMDIEVTVSIQYNLIWEGATNQLVAPSIFNRYFYIMSFYIVKIYLNPLTYYISYYDMGYEKLWTLRKET
jgi:hypothetical protein